MKYTGILILLSIIFHFQSSIVNPLHAQDTAAARTFVEKGYVLHEEGKYEEAIVQYKKALEADADNLIALSELGVTLFTLKRYEEVIEVSERAIEKHSRDENIGFVMITYGNTLDLLGRGQEALEMYDEGIEQFPQAYMLHFNKGVTLGNMKRFDEATGCFQMAMKKNPRHPGSHNALARMAAMDEKRIPALMAFFRFIILEPNTARSASALEIIQELLMQGVEEKGKKKVNININPEMLADTLPNGEPKSNSFMTIDLIVSMTSAMDFDKKHAKESEREKFLRKAELICSGLEEQLAEGTGFYWKYYAPYFVSMKNEGQLETFSYIVFAHTDDAAVTKWFKANESKVKAFYEWSGSHNWPSK